MEIDLFRSNEGYGRSYGKGYSSTVHAPSVDRRTNASVCPRCWVPVREEAKILVTIQGHAMCSSRLSQRG